MSILSVIKDACSRSAIWVGLTLSVVVSILVIFEGHCQFVEPYVGVHHRVPEDKNDNSHTGALLCRKRCYTWGQKDFISIIALHIPVYLVWSLCSELILKLWTVEMRSSARVVRCLFHSTSALMLMVSLILIACVMSKEGIWTSASLWWNGMPQGRMSCLLKGFCLIQLTMICYWLENLILSGQDFAAIRDEAIHGVGNLVFCVACYVLNFGPLMMVTFFMRFGLEFILTCVQILAFTDMSGKLGRYVFLKIVCHVHRWVSYLELVSYGMLAVALMISGDRVFLERGLLVAILLGALVAPNAFRLLSGRKYNLDGLQSGALLKPRGRPQLQEAHHMDRGTLQLSTGIHQGKSQLEASPGDTNESPETSLAAFCQLIQTS